MNKKETIKIILWITMSVAGAILISEIIQNEIKKQLDAAANEEISATRYKNS